MSVRTLLVPVLLSFCFLACDSEDPRLPESLYREALDLNRQGKTQEAKSLMDLVVKRYPGTTIGKKAYNDLFTINLLLQDDILERQRLVKTTMKRAMDALTRYREKHGEYPDNLTQLTPDYLEKVPETSWGHPFFYRPYVKNPIEDVPGRRGAITQRINTRCDGYFLVCLGVDLRPGGEDMAADIYAVNGDFYKDKAGLPPIPLPQPVK